MMTPLRLVLLLIGALVFFGLGWKLKTVSVERSAGPINDGHCQTITENVESIVGLVNRYYEEDGRDYKTYRAELIESLPDEILDRDNIYISTERVHPQELMSSLWAQRSIYETVCASTVRTEIDADLNKLQSAYPWLPIERPF
ncbi:MAG: hypothetical protein AAF269_12510 [Pseudomonadota bacterium]